MKVQFSLREQNAAEEAITLLERLEEHFNTSEEQVTWSRAVNKLVQIRDNLPEAP